MATHAPLTCSGSDYIHRRITCDLGAFGDCPVRASCRDRTKGISLPPCPCGSYRALFFGIGMLKYVGGHPEPSASRISSKTCCPVFTNNKNWIDLKRSNTSSQHKIVKLVVLDD